MPVLVKENNREVHYDSWTHYKNTKRQDDVHTAETPCPHCWGQRRIYNPVRRPNGDLIGYVPEDCATCLATGFAFTF